MKRIVHISDTHLGYNDLDRVTRDGINQREEDFYAAFDEAVDRIIDLAPDVVLHSGDFFHRPSPANRPMTRALMALARLRDAGIPFVVIAGNHETPRTLLTSPILQAFATQKGVYPIFAQRYESVELEGMRIHCVPHINDPEAFVPEVLKAAPEKGRVNILMLHATVGRDYTMEEFGEREIPDELYAHLKGFDYVAMGHWHNAQHIKKAGNAWYAGSTERTSLSQAARGKGFLEVTFDEGPPQVEFHELSLRPWHRYEVEGCAEKGYEKVKDELNTITSDIDYTDAMIHLTLKDMKPSLAVDLSSNSLKEIFPGHLSLQVKTEFQDGTIQSDEFTGFESLRDMFMNYIDANGGNGRDVANLKELASGYLDRVERGEE